ncbi:RICIN domain-containing protein [Streptomyces tubercidicus]|uniref:RICIN domain-containing protein n=1 Tax=Streptomyces tubercidicus TaxID=47759 RepID=UPI00346634B8
MFDHKPPPYLNSRPRRVSALLVVSLAALGIAMSPSAAHAAPGDSGLTDILPLPDTDSDGLSQKAVTAGAAKQEWTDFSLQGHAGKSGLLDEDTQTFTFKENSDGTFNLSLPFSEDDRLCLQAGQPDVPENAISASRCGRYNETYAGMKWKFEQRTGDYFTIRNVGTDKCMARQGSSVVLESCMEGDDPQKDPTIRKQKWMATGMNALLLD